MMLAFSTAIFPFSNNFCETKIIWVRKKYSSATFEWCRKFSWRLYTLFIWIIAFFNSYYLNSKNIQSRLQKAKVFFHFNIWYFILWKLILIQFIAVSESIVTSVQPPSPRKQIFERNVRTVILKIIWEIFFLNFFSE